jgi:aminoglycoside phosphotransferase family enzyme/predicted kinase
LLVLYGAVSARPDSHPEPAIVTDLRRPEAYPPPRPERVALAATHASWVFLTATEAWKLKRPVDFGFLDFSTPALRLRSCEEELRLGTRLAPDVYLGLAPVYLGPAGHRFVGPGRVVDHAVRMRRLPDEESALTLLAQDRLGPAPLARLAALLARFYATAPLEPEAGEPAVLAANVEENHRQLRPHAGRLVDAALAEEVTRWQRSALAAAGDRLRARVAEHRVREGHGDLRLEHVYFPRQPGRAPIVIDAIEFNRRFRCLDAALDASFLAMELDAARRPDLAAQFLCAFARESDDYGLFPLLDLYLSYRAFVRAKVACFVAADPETPARKSERKRQEAVRLLALAAGYTRPRRRPAVLAIGGLPGAGKSTLAEALTAVLGAPAVSADATRKHLGGIALDQRGDPGLYTPAFTRLTYQQMLARAGAVLESGRPVILDATFRHAAERAEARALAARHGCPFRFVEVTCDEATLRDRLRARAHAGPSLSDADEAVLERIRAEFEPPVELAPGERCRVDTRADPHAAARALGERLSLGG